MSALLGREPLPEAAVEALKAQDQRFVSLFEAIGPLSYRHRPDGFLGLYRLIIEQQLSVKAAASIKARLDEALGEVTAQSLLAMDDEALRSCGLSRPKVSYLKALAQAILSGDLDFTQVRQSPLEEAIGLLTSVKGIGRWSAEVYLMFCEGRLDLFPTGDIALREALGWFYGHEARPDEKTCAALVEAWSPYRSVAAHLLWAWYGAVKRGEMGQVIP